MPITLLQALPPPIFKMLSTPLYCDIGSASKFLQVEDTSDEYFIMTAVI